MVMWCDICGAKLENGETLSECPECLCPFENVDKNSPRKEFKSPIPDGNLVKVISTDENFMKSMTELYEKDPIEYQLKISQFKASLKQQESSKPKEDNTLRCPTCNSTKVKKISATSKVVGASMFGLFSKTARSQFKCEQCGYKW